MTTAFPFHEDCYTWPRVGVFTENSGEPRAAELHVHCIYHPLRDQHHLVAFVGVGREEQIGQVINLAQEVGAVVKIIDGSGFTDEVIGVLMAHLQASPDDPGGSFCCVPVEEEVASVMNWPNKTQRRVLRELAEVSSHDGGSLHEERLAKRLNMPVEEVRRHLQALADLGMVEEFPKN